MRCCAAAFYSRNRANESDDSLKCSNRGLQRCGSEYSSDYGAKQQHSCYIAAGRVAERRPEETARQYAVVNAGVVHNGRDEIALCIREAVVDRQFFAYCPKQDGHSPGEKLRHRKQRMKGGSRNQKGSHFDRPRHLTGCRLRSEYPGS
jgi:hypothetical protein